MSTPGSSTTGGSSGGKPVPGVGWIFTPRNPVRGPKSRQATGKAKRTAALPAPAKAAELAKAARKVAARRATRSDGTPARIGDVWQAEAGRAGVPDAAPAPLELVGDGTAASAGDGREEAVAAKATKVAKGTKAAKATKASKATKATKAAKKAAKATKAAKKAAKGKEADGGAAATGAAKAATKAAKGATTTKPAKAAKASKPVKAAEATKKAAKAPKKAAGASTKAAEVTGSAGRATKATKTTKATKATEKAARATTKGAEAEAAAGPREEATGAAPVRQPVKQAAKKARRAPKAPKVPDEAAAEPVDLATRRPATDARLLEAIHEATAEALAPPERSATDGAAGGKAGGKKGKGGGKGSKRRRATPPPAVNEPLSFINFVAAYPVGSEVEGEVASYTSHGAMIEVTMADGGSLHCYVPLTGLGDPPPRKAREVLARGQRQRFVLVALDPPRRVAELALPGLAPVELERPPVGA